MSSNIEFTKEILDKSLTVLGKEFRKRNGKKMPADIILIGGASVLINYGFREMTTDADAVIRASSVMREAIHCVADKLDLPRDWLNDDFKRTDSYTENLSKVAKSYRTFSNVLHVRTVSAEYLIAMKLMSGRQYKYDLSDVVGILSEHDKRGEPISRKMIDMAVKELYEDQPLPTISTQLLDDVFNSEDYVLIYNKIRKIETQGKEYLLEFHKEYTDVRGVKADDIIERARQKAKK